MIRPTHYIFKYAIAHKFYKKGDYMCHSLRDMAELGIISPAERKQCVEEIFQYIYSDAPKHVLDFYLKHWYDVGIEHSERWYMRTMYCVARKFFKNNKLKINDEKLLWFAMKTYADWDTRKSF